MPELYRLEGRSEKGNCTLILTDIELVLVPDEAFRHELVAAFEKGREGAERAPGVIGWFVEKVMGVAENALIEAFKPHPLSEVHLHLKHDTVTIGMGRMHYGSVLKVDPAEAYIFDAKFQEAKAALSKQ